MKGVAVIPHLPSLFAPLRSAISLFSPHARGRQWHFFFADIDIAAAEKGEGWKNNFPGAAACSSLVLSRFRVHVITFDFRCFVELFLPAPAAWSIKDALHSNRSATQYDFELKKRGCCCVRGSWDCCHLFRSIPVTHENFFCPSLHLLVVAARRKKFFSPPVWPRIYALVEDQPVKSPPPPLPEHHHQIFQERESIPLICRGPCRGRGRVKKRTHARGKRGELSSTFLLLLRPPAGPSGG